ncbi:MAG: hypothetical protein Q7S34_03460 [bacterium]|nr:hypothetical protein [bacterium]
MRYFLNGILLGSFLFMPFWLTATLAVSLIFFYERYWPALVLAVISDLLFVSSKGGYFHLYFFFTIFAILFLFLGSLVRSRLWKKSYQY